MTRLKNKFCAGAKMAAFAAVLALPTVSSGLAETAETVEAVKSKEEPVQTTATFRDWTVRCRQVAENKTQQCEMVQVLSTADRKNTVANLAIGQLPGDDAVRFVLQLPIGVHLPTNVAFAIGKEEITTARFETCFPTFCLAYATLEEDAIEQMRSGLKMTMTLKDRAKRDLVMPLSLKGFTAAYAATFSAGS